MISIIGSKRSLRGVSFIEVMVTLAVLSGGLVMIYRALFLSVDYAAHLNMRLQAQMLLSNRMEEMQKGYQVHGAVPVQFAEDTISARFREKRKDLALGSHYQSVEGLDQLIHVDLLLSWGERNRTISLPRSAYISKL